ncbi:MAG: hypothetical protein ACI8ZM_003613 [Crocinitomix sp.]|jgi:hypothetical protein
MLRPFPTLKPDFVRRSNLYVMRPKIQCTKKTASKLILKLLDEMKRQTVVSKKVY